MAKQKTADDVQNSVPDKRQTQAGSLNNMPTPEEMHEYNTNVKPKLIAGIRKSWGNTMRHANNLNHAQSGKIAYKS